MKKLIAYLTQKEPLLTSAALTIAVILVQQYLSTSPPTLPTWPGVLAVFALVVRQFVTSPRTAAQLQQDIHDQYAHLAELAPQLAATIPGAEAWRQMNPVINFGTPTVLPGTNTIVPDPPAPPTTPPATS